MVPMGESKVCADCQQALPLSSFGTRRAASGNTVPKAYCRPCSAARARSDYDSDRARANYQKRMAEDPEQLLERSRAWAANNPDKRRASVRKWRENNAEKVKAYSRKYKVANRDIVAAWQMARQARQRGSAIAPFTAEQLRQRMSMYAGCWMCGGPKEHVDHVKPISKGGAHILSNLRPACRKCNLSKKDQWPLRVKALPRSASRLLTG